MRQEMTGLWDAVASAGQYANNLHLAPDRQPYQHLITQFLQAGALLKPNQQCQGTEGNITVITQCTTFSFLVTNVFSSVLKHLWLGDRKCIQAVKKSTHATYLEKLSSGASRERK